MRMALFAASLLLGTVTIQDPASRPNDKIAVGVTAPEFTLNDHEGKGTAVGGRSAEWQIIAFYPKAATPG